MFSQSNTALKFLEAVKNGKNKEAIAMIKATNNRAGLLSAKDVGLKNFRNSGWTVLHWICYHDNTEVLRALVEDSAGKLSGEQLKAALCAPSDEPWRLYLGRDTFFGFEYRKFFGFNGRQTPLHLLRSDEAKAIIEGVLPRKFNPRIMPKMEEFADVKDALDRTPSKKIDPQASIKSPLGDHAADFKKTAEEIKNHFKENYDNENAQLWQIVKDFFDEKYTFSGKGLLNYLSGGFFSKPAANPKEALVKNIFNFLVNSSSEKLSQTEMSKKIVRIAQHIITTGLDLASLDQNELLSLIEKEHSPRSPR